MAAALIEPGITLYPLDSLPPFNADLDGNEPEAVKAFQAALSKADAVIICSPEYAHGISGVLKNALDWVVSSGELFGKPMGTINSSPHSHHAMDSLHEILRTMGTALEPEACITLALRGAKLDAQGIAQHPEHAATIRHMLQALPI